MLGDIAVGEGVVTLDRVHRFGGAIAGVADAIRRGEVKSAEAVEAYRAILAQSPTDTLDSFEDAIANFDAVITTTGTSG